jgi:hypothetical protein
MLRKPHSARNFLLTILLLAPTASAQVPVVTVIPTGQRNLRYRSEDQYQVVRQPGGRFVFNLFPSGSVDVFRVALHRPVDSAFYVEHLGQRIDLTIAPHPFPLRTNQYPGTLQAPVVAACDGTSTEFIGSLDLQRPVRIIIDADAIAIEFVGPFPALTTTVLPVFIGSDAGSGGERAQVVRLARRYRTLGPIVWTAPPRLAYSNGLWAFQGQDSAYPRSDVYRLAETLPDTGLAGLIWWGVPSDLGGGCCELDQSIHPRYGRLPEFAGLLGLDVWAYARPKDTDPDWWESWTRLIHDRGMRVYGDAVGYRALDPASVPADAVIEGASLAYTCPALVANAFTGGGFVNPEGRFPFTLPDGRPHPQSPQPWMTSAPWLGKTLNIGVSGNFPMLQPDRVLLWGPQNHDGFLDAPDTTWDGQQWYEPGPRSAFVYDLYLLPTRWRPIYDDIVAAREAVGWRDQRRHWRDLEGFLNVPAGVRLGTWIDLRTNIRWAAIDSIDAVGSWTLSYNGTYVPRPANGLSIVELPQ